ARPLSAPTQRPTHPPACLAQFGWERPLSAEQSARSPARQTPAVSHRSALISPKSHLRAGLRRSYSSLVSGPRRGVGRESQMLKARVTISWIYRPGGGVLIG